MPDNKKRIDEEILFHNANEGILLDRGFKAVKNNRIVPNERNVDFKMPKNNGNLALVVDTVGIELESIALTKGVVANILQTLPIGLGNNFKVHRDGSSEMKVFAVALNRKGARRKEILEVNLHTNAAQDLFRRNNSNTNGFELISVPMDINTAEITLWSLLPKLEWAGDFFSKRCAIHVHVGMMKNLAIVKRLLKLGLWADELFFALAGMGKQYRGTINNSIYARPLIAGPYFKYRDSYYQTLNWERALGAESFQEFFSTYHIDVNDNPAKYHPARYFSWNIYSILVHGTLEFRYFNQCFSPALVSSVTKLSQMVAEIGVKARDKDLISFDTCDPFETQSTLYYENKLDILLRLAKVSECTYGLNDGDIEVLLSKDILNRIFHIQQ